MAKNPLPWVTTTKLLNIFNRKLRSRKKNQCVTSVVLSTICFHINLMINLCTNAGIIMRCNYGIPFSNLVLIS